MHHLSCAWRQQHSTRAPLLVSASRVQLSRVECFSWSLDGPSKTDMCPLVLIKETLAVLKGTQSKYGRPLVGARAKVYLPDPNFLA